MRRAGHGSGRANDRKIFMLIRVIVITSTEQLFLVFIVSIFFSTLSLSLLQWNFLRKISIRIASVIEFSLPFDHAMERVRTID